MDGGGLMGFHSPWSYKSDQATVASAAHIYIQIYMKTFLSPHFGMLFIPFAKYLLNYQFFCPILYRFLLSTMNYTKVET